MLLSTLLLPEKQYCTTWHRRKHSWMSQFDIDMNFVTRFFLGGLQNLFHRGRHHGRHPIVMFSINVIRCYYSCREEGGLGNNLMFNVIQIAVIVIPLLYSGSARVVWSRRWQWTSFIIMIIVLYRSRESLTEQTLSFSEAFNSSVVY